MVQLPTQPGFEEVKSRAYQGVISLVSRSFLVQIIAFGSNFLLTVFLEPKIFGIYFLVSALINFFAYFSDVGLAAALIQKKSELTERDLKTTFTVQQLLVITLVSIIFLIAPIVQRSYGLSHDALLLLYALAFSFFLSSLKTIPSVLLERNLKFNLLVIPQIVETLIFNLLAVFLAWKGFGLASFTWAVLVRGLVGLVLMYLVSPWRIGLAWSKEALRGLIKFGAVYQINTIIAVLKDDFMTIILGRIIGTTGLGYLGWAKKWAEQPLRFFMDNVTKVAFPAYSRLQDDPEKLKKAIEKTLFYLTLLTFPILTIFSILASDLVAVIPRYAKWQPALIPLYLYCLNSAWATVSTPLTNLLNSTGRIKSTFKLMLMWLFLSWGLMPWLGIKFGYIGVAAATGIISFSSLVVVIMVKKIINFSLTNSIIKPLVATMLMGLVVFFVRVPALDIKVGLLTRLIIGSSTYFIVMYLLVGKELMIGFYDIFKKTIHK